MEAGTKSRSRFPLQGQQLYHREISKENMIHSQKASMASRCGGSMVHNQNLNIPCNDASVGCKTNVSKTRKGGLGGRKPLGDLSNSLKPSVNQTSKKQLSSISSFTDLGCTASQTAPDASKRKTNSRASMKVVMPAGSKPLCVLPEEVNYPSAVAEERFLHNHKNCITAQAGSMDMDKFLQTLGLESDFSKQFASPCVRHLPHKVKADSPPRHLELYEMTELVASDLGSPRTCSSPVSPCHFTQWKDLNNVNFELLESPKFLKY